MKDCLPPIGECLPNLLGHLVANFVAAWANGGANSYQNVPGIGAVTLLKGTNNRCCNFSSCSPPTGMGSTDSLLDRIVEENWNTVGSLGYQADVGMVGYHGVAVG